MLYFHIYISLKKMGYSEKGSNEKKLYSHIINILIYAYKIILNLKHVYLLPIALSKRKAGPGDTESLKKI